MWPNLLLFLGPYLSIATGVTRLRLPNQLAAVVHDTVSLYIGCCTSLSFDTASLCISRCCTVSHLILPLCALAGVVQSLI